MSEQEQVEKNLNLSKEIHSFLTEHPEINAKLPSNATIVPMTSRDEVLNDENQTLIKNLLDEGEEVVTAVETNNSKEPWKFSPVFKSL